jgi:hypothetical protein
LLNKLSEEKSRLAVGTASGGPGLVNDGRIPESEVFPTVGRAIFDNRIKGQADDILCVLLGIGDSGRAANELRIRAIRGAEPSQSPQNIGYMRAEDTTIDMDLIYYDILEIPKKPGP